MLPGNGWPSLGSMIVRAPVKNWLLGSSSSLKLPVRISAVGTVATLVWIAKKLTHSCAAKKNSLSFTR